LPAGREIPIAQVDIHEEDIEAVVQVLRSGKLRQGARTAEFEGVFARRVGAKHAVAVSSGTAALHVAYLAVFQPGDEVIVPAFTFVATASMLSAIGAIPVFADVSSSTFTMCLSDAESKVTERTRGLAPVHLFGNSVDVKGFTKLARANGLKLVWDAAQALGTRFQGRDVGEFDDVVCYSFYPTKNITTGEGGMIVTNDDELARRLRLIRSQGAEDKYRHVTIGFNYRMTDFQSAMGIKQLGRLDEGLSLRRRNAGLLSEGLADIEEVTTPSVQQGACDERYRYCRPLSLNAVEPTHLQRGSGLSRE
jgi:perosamine synthetase